MAQERDQMRADQMRYEETRSRERNAARNYTNNRSTSGNRMPPPRVASRPPAISTH